jgi:hypothetical protein
VYVYGVQREHNFFPISCVRHQDLQKSIRIDLIQSCALKAKSFGCRFGNSVAFCWRVSSQLAPLSFISVRLGSQFFDTCV